MERMVATNELGYRIGQDHHNAVLSDREVELLLRLRAEGWGWRRLAAKLEISKTQCRRICKGLQRSQLVVVYRVASVRPVPVGAEQEGTVEA